MEACEGVRLRRFSRPISTRFGGFFFARPEKAEVATTSPTVGEELPDKHAAWREATVTAGQMLQSIDGKHQPNSEWRMEVMDELQNRLFVLRISAERP